jgi:hypothetical protein
MESNFSDDIGFIVDSLADLPDPRD